MSTPDSIYFFPPLIKPLSIGEDQPLWSVMIPVHNNAKFIEETILSVLVQGISEEYMQIEVVDDASSDADVETLVKNIGKGRVKYYRQKQNVGSLRNFETCINRSVGKIVHILHGDDKILPGYYEKMGNLFQKYPNIGAAFCRYTYIDETGQTLYIQPKEKKQEGVLDNWLLKIATYNSVQYVSMVVRREVYERLGGFYAITYGEDWEMWVRIVKSYSVAYTPEILAQYRKHISSISGQKILSGKYLIDLQRVMELIQEHLPAGQKKRVLEESKKFYAYYALRTANHIWHISKNRSKVEQSVQIALRMHVSAYLLYKVGKLYAKIYLSTLLRK
jgi:glycosyltransferase involved in cell wall biosynthesis